MHHTFKLADRAGKQHEYRVEPHPGTVGLSIALKVQALVAEPIVEVVRAALASPGIERIGAALREGTDADPGELLAGALGDLIPALREADLGMLARAVSAALASPGGPQLARDILSRSYRDGRALSEPMVFDEAYQANYGELMRALLEVVQHNGFFPLGELLSATGNEPPDATAKALPPRSSRAKGT